jgi:hypothetical protein
MTEVDIISFVMLLAACIQQTTLFSWKEDWMAQLVNDMLDIFLIFHVGATFSPMNEVAVTRAFGTFNNPGLQLNNNNNNNDANNAHQ